MPDVRRKSALKKQGRYFYRLFDKEKEQWYAKTSTYGRTWTSYEWQGRVYKRKSDLINSMNYASLSLSEDRYEIVEYKLERTGQDEGIVVRESFYEKMQREKREQQERDGSARELPRPRLYEGF
jgi:hypothetical protein